MDASWINQEARRLGYGVLCQRQRSGGDRAEVVGSRVSSAALRRTWYKARINFNFVRHVFPSTFQYFK